MATLPIQSLAPENAPPTNASIRGIVTLCWPYSSSTKQCALLLADPDFRLRNKQGQVRVRFVGASAEAVAKAHVGIGDEVVLQLQGASWAQDIAPTRTPGRSVDGELSYGRRLGLELVRAEGSVNVEVDAPTPPRSPRASEMEPVATPAQNGVHKLRSSLGGTPDSIAIYSSPAFTRRLRLSGTSFSTTAYDPFVDDDLDVEQPNKKQRVSFGNLRQARYAERSPSPVKDTSATNAGDKAEQPSQAQRDEPTADLDVGKQTAGGDEAGMSLLKTLTDGANEAIEPKRMDLDEVASTSSPVARDTIYAGLPKSVGVQTPPLPTSMAPPPLPRLQMPDQPSSPEVLETQETADLDGGPSTPKLQAVPNSALPLPSPFPADASSPSFKRSSVASMLDGSDDRDYVRHSEHTDSNNASNETYGQIQHVRAPVASESTSAPPATLNDDELSLPQRGTAVLQTVDSSRDTVKKDHPRRPGQPALEAFAEGEIERVELPQPPQDTANEDYYNNFEVQSSPVQPHHETTHDMPANIDEDDMREASSDIRSQPQTPIKQLPSDFGLDGTSSVPQHSQSTPQSEREQVMERTFKSLFGYSKFSDTQPEPPVADKVQNPMPLVGSQEQGRDQSRSESIRVSSPPPEQEPFGQLNGSSQQTPNAEEDGKAESFGERSTSGSAESTHVIDRYEAREPEEREDPDADDDVRSSQLEEAYEEPSRTGTEPPRGSATKVIELDSSSDVDQNEGPKFDTQRKREPSLRPLPGLVDDPAEVAIQPTDDVEMDEDLSSPLATSQLDHLEEDIRQAAGEDISMVDVGVLHGDVQVTARQVSAGPPLISSPPAELEPPRALRPLNKRSQVATSLERPFVRIPAERIVEGSQEGSQSGTLSTQPTPTAESFDTISIPRRELRLRSPSRDADLLERGAPMAGKDRDEVAMLSPAPLIRSSDVHFPPPSTAQTHVIELGSSSPVAYSNPEMATPRAGLPALGNEVTMQRMVDVSDVETPRAGSPAPLSGLMMDPMEDVPAAESIFDDFLEPDMLDSPAQSQFAAARPIDNEQLVLSPSEAAAFSEIMASNEAALSPSSRDEALSEPEVLSHVTAPLPAAGSTTEQIPELDQPTFESQEQLITTIQPVTYPSLPLSPLQSQSQETSYTVAPQTFPDTLASAMPPTPQLTQVESDMQVEQLVVAEEEQSRSQSQKQDGERQGTTVEARAPEAVVQTDLSVDQLPPKQVTAAVKEIAAQAGEVVEQPLLPPNVDEPLPTAPKTPARRSLKTRLSHVPDVISAWFSPKQTGGTTVDTSTHEPLALAQGAATAMPKALAATTNGHEAVEERRESSNGTSTALGYFTPIVNVESKLNPLSQDLFGGSTVDVLAVVTDSTKVPERAKGGPRDYYTIFRIADTSVTDNATIRVEVFRPWKAVLPVAEVGDVVLLRAFTVKSKKRQPYLLSTDASAWCVWRFTAASQEDSNNERPPWARLHVDGSPGKGREEIKGPPVELGDEERQHAKVLRDWWVAARGADEQAGTEKEQSNGVASH